MVEVKDGWLIINEDINDLSSIDFSGQTKIYFGYKFIRGPIFMKCIDELPLTIKYIIVDNILSYRDISNKIFLNKFVKKIMYQRTMTNISILPLFSYYLHHYRLIISFIEQQLCIRRCEINKHNHAIRKTKLVDLLLK